MPPALAGTPLSGRPALRLLIRLSFPDPVPFQPPDLIQHKQPLWFPYTNSHGFRVSGAFLPTSLLAFRRPPTSSLPHPLQGAASSLSGREGLGTVPGAGRPSAFHLEGTLHFSPLTQKNMVLRKLVFSTESSQRKKNRESRRGFSPTQSSDSQPLAPESCSSLGGKREGAACRGPAAGDNKGREF